MTMGGASARMVPSSGIVTWKSESASSRNASNGSSVRSSSSMSRTGGPAVLRLHRLEQRPADEVALGEELLGERVPVGRALRLGGADRHHLRRKVPLVDGAGGVEALVALQADEAAAEGLGQRLGDLGLADPGLAFEEERPSELQRQEDDGGEPAAGDVAGAGEQRLRVVDAGRQCCHVPLPPCPAIWMRALAKGKPGLLSLNRR